MKKYGKRFIAFGLTLAMATSAVPVSANIDMKLNAKSKIIAVGDKTNLTVKNKIKKATYVWTSHNKKVATVNQKGVVIGKKKGVTTISCIVNNGNKKRELTATITVLPLKKINTVKSITVGDTLTLAKKEKKGIKYTYTTSDKKIATVNQKGIVKAYNPGEVTIRCLISGSKKDSITEYKIKVNTEKKVVSQVQLNKALKNGKLKNIIIETKKAENFIIPNGNYKKVKLIVNAPNSDITNNGEFEEIEIKNIKPSTWHEKANGNHISVDAKKASLVIEENASVESLVFTKEEAKAGVQVNGKVKEVLVEKKAELALTVNGTMEQVKVNAPAELTLSGTTKEQVQVTMEREAEGSKIDSAIKVLVETPVKVDMILQKGAEGSTVTVTEKEVNVQLENKTEDKVIINVPDGSKEVGKGEVSTENKVDPSTGGGSVGIIGGGSMGGDIPSGGDGTGSPSKPDTYKIEVVETETKKILVGESTTFTLQLKNNDKDVEITEEIKNNFKVVGDEKIEIGEIAIKEDGTLQIEVIGEAAGEGTVAITYEDSQKDIKAELSLAIMVVGTVTVDELNKRIQKEENYVLNEEVTVATGSSIEIPKDHTLVIGKLGRVKVEEGGKINNLGILTTASEEKNIRVFSDEVQEESCLEVQSGGVVMIPSGASITLNQLEDVSTEENDAIICQVGGEFVIGNKKYISPKNTDLLRFVNSDTEDAKDDRIMISRNGDNEVCFYIMGKVEIPDEVEDGALDCRIIVSGGRIKAELKIPRLSVIAQKDKTSIHAESGSKLIIGDKVYFTPNSDENAIFTVTEGSQYHSNKGVTLFSNSENSIIEMGICGEITMNELCEEYLVTPENRSEETKAILTFNINRDEGDVTVAKGWTLTQENYHSTYIRDAEGNWELQTPSEEQ